jgi:hypothetical protein
MQKITRMLTVLVAVFALAPAAVLADGTAVASRAEPMTAPGGYPAKYRLMFITSTITNASSTDISFYNTFVNDVANNLGGNTGSIVAGLGVTWRCIGSTETVGARTNSKTLKTTDGGYDADWDVPIYTFSGELLADSNAHVWDGALLEPGYDSNGIWDNLAYETGNENMSTPPGVNSYGLVFTGTDTAGNPYNAATVKWLGHTDVRAGKGPGRLWSPDWIGHGSGSTDPTVPRYFLGLSDPITAPVYTYYTLTFDPQGGSALSEASRQVTSFDYTYGFGGTLPTVTAPAGKIFWAWYEDAAATGPALTDSSPLVIAGPKTVYAGHIPAYTLTFDAQGGTPSEASRQVSALDGTYGFRGTLPTVTPPAGQIFCGWFEDAAATGSELFESTTMVISANKSIYAKIQELWDGPEEPLLTDGLLGYWSFNDATADDSSGNDYHGAWVGTAVYSSNDIPHGFGGVSADMTGGANSIGVSTGGSEDIFDVEEHSIAFWTKGEPNGDWGYWIAKEGGFRINQRMSGKYEMNYHIWGDGEARFGIDHSDNHWHHYAMTYDSSGDNSGTKNVYHNGVVVKTEAGKDPPANLRTLAFGDRDESDDTGFQSVGGTARPDVRLDEIYFFNRAITPEEVMTLYTQPTPPPPAGTVIILK